MTDQPIKIVRKDLGVIDGLQTWEVSDSDTGQVIGYDQTASE